MRRSYSSQIILILTVSLMAGSMSAQSIWQKIKQSAQQTGQNTAQQGSQQVQQKIQQQVPAGQSNGQPPCGSLTNTAGTSGATLNNASYSTGNANSCGPQCFNAGPFAAAVTQMTMSQQGYYHIIRMNVQFQNLTNQPLIIAYHDGSMVMVDNNGATYGPAGGNPGELQGMGIDRGNQTDSQFMLGPGQTGSALFSVARGRGNDSPIGTGFTYNLTIDELQTQNGAQAIPVRQYNLNFPTLSPSASGSTLAGAAGSPAASSFAGTGTAGTAGAASTAMPVAGQGKAVSVGGAANPAVNAAAARNARAPVSNAALQTNAAATAKPAAAVKPIPAKTAAKKTTTTPATTTTTPTR